MESVHWPALFEYKFALKITQVRCLYVYTVLVTGFKLLKHHTVPIEHFHIFEESEAAYSANLILHLSQSTMNVTTSVEANATTSVPDSTSMGYNITTLTSMNPTIIDIISGIINFDSMRFKDYLFVSVQHKVLLLEQ